MHHSGSPVVHHSERGRHRRVSERRGGGGGHTQTAPQPAGGLLYSHQFTNGLQQIGKYARRSQEGLYKTEISLFYQKKKEWC